MAVFRSESGEGRLEAKASQIEKEPKKSMIQIENDLQKHFFLSVFIATFGALLTQKLQMYSWDMLITFLGVGMNIGAWARYKREIECNSNTSHSRNSRR